jgi:eukaryotic-like serine/threonine-protein kinase
MQSTMQLTDRSLARSCTFKLVQGVLQEEQSLLTAAPSHSLAAGAIIDSKFRIVSLLGEGGMGAVYRAKHLTLGNEVALKTFRSRDLSPAVWERFQREVKAIAMLENKNIVRVFDSGIDQTNVPYYTMELLTGESLAHRIRRQGPLPIEEALAIFRAVAEALVSAHAKGIVHRDLKPENIFLILKDNNVESTKLVDFGIAKLTDMTEPDAQRLTSAGTIFGSPLYMSPEQSLGEETDARSDIYSYGCAFYEALTGLPPLFGDTAFATIMKHQNDVPARIDERAPERDFPSWLPSLLAKMLAKSKEKRVQNFQEILDVFSFYRKKERKAARASRERKKTAAPQDKARPTVGGSVAELVVAELVVAEPVVAESVAGASPKKDCSWFVWCCLAGPLPWAEHISLKNWPRDALLWQALNCPGIGI